MVIHTLRNGRPAPSYMHGFLVVPAELSAEGRANPSL